MQQLRPEEQIRPEPTPIKSQPHGVKQRHLGRHSRQHLSTGCGSGRPTRSQEHRAHSAGCAQSLADKSPDRRPGLPLISGEPLLPPCHHTGVPACSDQFTHQGASFHSHHPQESESCWWGTARQPAHPARSPHGERSPPLPAASGLRDAGPDVSAGEPDTLPGGHSAPSLLP